MLREKLVEFTRSCPRRCNDNALADSKNGNLVRRQFGYSHVPARRAKQFTAFCKEYLNPYLNLHRPCLFGTEVPDPRKPGRTRRVHRQKDVMTPLEKLLTLPDVRTFLREGISIEDLKQQARSMTEIEAARWVRRAREELMGVPVEMRQFRDVWSYAAAAAA